MTNNKTEGVKPVKERDTLDLLNLVCELHARSLMHGTKELHDASVEARKELESRLSPPAGVEQRAKEYADRIVPNANPNDAPYYTTGDKWDDIHAAFIAGSESQGREAVDWKAEYEKCVAIINRFNSGTIPPPASPE